MGIRVIDTIAIKSSYGIADAPGVVAVLEDFHPVDPRTYVGKTAAIRPPIGPPLSARIDEVRDHGPTISLFFRGLEPDSVPIGSLLDLDV